MGQSLDPNGDSQTQVIELSKTLGHVTICKKGQTDIISDGHHGKLNVQFTAAVADAITIITLWCYTFFLTHS